MLLLTVTGCAGEKPAGESLEEKKVDLSLYQPIKDKYEQYAKTHPQKPQDELNDLIDMFYNNSYYIGTYTALYDVDKNGVPELFVAVKSMTGDYHTLDIYTIANGEAKRLTTKEKKLHHIGERMNIMPLVDGNFLYRGSGGAFKAQYTLYKFSDDKTELEEIKTGASVEEIGGHSELVHKDDFQWELLGAAREAPFREYAMRGMYQHLEGKWKNAKGKEITIYDNQYVKYKGHDGTSTITYKKQQNVMEGSEEIVHFMLVSEVGTGAAFEYMPPQVPAKVWMVEGLTEAGKERIYIGQSIGVPEDVYYRMVE